MITRGSESIHDRAVDWARREGIGVRDKLADGTSGAVFATDCADVVLKLGRRHDESRDEAEGLRAWSGDGAIRVFGYERFDELDALLIERCRPGTPLSTRPEPEQDEVIAGLLQRLWRAPTTGHPFRSLVEMCDIWAHEAERREPVIDAALMRDGLALFRSLPRDAERSVLLCTDLHAGNVLAAEREPWLVTDPKPYVGDPAYDVLQHCLNCDRLRTSPIDLAHRIADLCDLERDRVRQWLFARCVQQSTAWPELASVARSLEGS